MHTDMRSSNANSWASKANLRWSQAFYWLTFLGRSIFHSSPCLYKINSGQCREALVFSLICARINGLENNREAGDFIRHRAHYDVIVMDRTVLLYLWVYCIMAGMSLWAVFVWKVRESHVFETQEIGVLNRKPLLSGTSQRRLRKPGRKWRFSTGNDGL